MPDYSARSGYRPSRSRGKRSRRGKFSESSFDNRSEKRGLFLMAILVCFAVSFAINFWYEAGGAAAAQ